MAKGVKVFPRGKRYRDNFDSIFYAKRIKTPRELYAEGYPPVPENGDKECQAEMFPSVARAVPPTQVTE